MRHNQLGPYLSMYVLVFQIWPSERLERHFVSFYMLNMNTLYEKKNKSCHKAYFVYNEGFISTLQNNCMCYVKKKLNSGVKNIQERIYKKH